ncbi:MAG: hypothetical protein HYT50_00980 [Candidatus Wildermuthbacteria bacterium]|nr:hypothetical protein [Candidatus Wildermuthbacteria bacterium]
MAKATQVKLIDLRGSEQSFIQVLQFGDQCIEAPVIFFRYRNWEEAAMNPRVSVGNHSPECTHGIVDPSIDFNGVFACTCGKHLLILHTQEELDSRRIVMLPEELWGKVA